MNRYYDNAATSWPKPACVSEAVCKIFLEARGNPGRSNNPLLDRIPFQTRNLLARLINASDGSQIAFGYNATYMINIGIRGLITKGDRVVTTSMEHNAVSRPLRYLEKLGIISLDIVKCSPDGYLDPDDLKNSLQSRTALVIVNHSSNVTGAVNELEPIGQIVRDHGAVCMIDCSQTIGAIPVDVERDKIDILAGPGHKNLLGPTGTGFLYISDRISLEPLIMGGTGTHSELDIQPTEFPECYESGTLNFHGLAGLRAALEYVHSMGLEAIVNHKNKLCERILEGLEAIPGIRLIGPNTIQNRSLVFSIVLENEKKDLADLANILLEDHGIITRTGLHCSPWAHKTIGTFPNGCVRLSPGLFHTIDDIDRMLKNLEKSARKCM
ncbi:aminotransferase class V-fold PLP-dependent enzyme [bacterium]|nr:aminotransferase class V-fold PLP-dependent enzyme [bacterium]